MKGILFALAVTLPAGLGLDDTVKLDQGVEYIGMQAPEEVAVGETLPIDFYYRFEKPLGEEYWIFTHVEIGGDRFRRLVRDMPPAPAEGGIVKHHVEVPVPSDVERTRFEIYTGVWNRETDERLAILEPPSMDDRIHAGWVRMVGTSSGKGARTVSPADTRTQKAWIVVKPWVGWIAAVVVSCALAIALGRMRRRFEGRVGSILCLPDPGPGLYLSIAALLVPLMLTILVALDFVKDDAYISFRYAHNLVTGRGFVFNPGDRLEGITNLLWTLVLAPFEAMGADLFQVSEILGTVLCIGLMVSLTLIAVGWSGARRSMSHLWAGLWLATSSSLGLWSTSGMEQPLAMFLPVTSLLLLWRSRGRPAWMLWSGILMALGCMTRPEIHLMGMIAGITVLWDAARARKIDRGTILWVAACVGLLVPFHLARYLYFGSLVANTYYVKTGASLLLMIRGLEKIHDMFSFNWTGALAVLVPLAFIDGKHLKEKIVAAAIAVGFMLYIVKVGVDEMEWHRLYLPALPFLALVAANGLQNLVDAAGALVPSRRASIAAGWILVAVAVSWNFRFTYESKAGFNGRGELSGTYHPDMGKFLTRHERPGALVAFQDMGSTPYHAPDLDFFDFIGLTEGKVARTRHAFGLNAYSATENYKNQAKYDAEMRDYFFEKSPEWTILTVYVPQGAQARVAELFARTPGPEAMLGFEHQNSYQFQVTRDPRFQKGYVHVRTWPRSRGYYLMLYRRRDLWEKTPGEIVLDSVPPGLGGAAARFAGGIELLGSEVEHEAVEKHEAFVTTWWKVPGPMDPDLTFFLHVESSAMRSTLDHPPGDWMYTADRWKPGEIIEDRVLFQVPVEMKPGTYRIYIGVFRRSTGERLAIVEGPDDGTGRVPLGTLEVTHMLWLVHQLIPPTDIDKQRKYPDRIIDPG